MKKLVSVKQSAELLETLKKRFEKNISRHKNLEWKEIEKKLRSQKEKLRSLYEMEKSGGEPDVVEYDKKTGEFIFYDCAEQSPSGRRSFCYDENALKSRKKNKPKNSALGFTKEIGIEILTEEEYRFLQSLGEFDTKSQSWIK